MILIMYEVNNRLIKLRVGFRKVKILKKMLNVKTYIIGTQIYITDIYLPAIAIHWKT